MKISEFTNDTAITLDDYLPLIEATGPTTKRATLQTVADLLNGSYTTWSPTITGITGGTLTTARYTIHNNKTCEGYLLYTMAGANVTGNVTFTMPVTLHASLSGQIIGMVKMRDSGTATYVGNVEYNTTGNIATVYAMNASVTYLAGGYTLSSTIPFTWANGDTIQFLFRGEIA